ncbi:MAG TPA: hypothetical protein VID48_01270 [Solirubrobacteraceae bacterium]
MRSWRVAAALRRIGSLADQLPIPGLANQLHPLAPPTRDILLEPGALAGGERAFRDRRWRVAWTELPSTIVDGLGQ